MSIPLKYLRSITNEDKRVIDQSSTNDLNRKSKILFIGAFICRQNVECIYTNTLFCDILRQAKR